MAMSHMEAGDDAFEQGISSHDEGSFGAAIEHYSRALELELGQDGVERAGGTASAERVTRCYARRALSRLHVADVLSMKAVSTRDIEKIAEPYLQCALEDTTLGLEIDPGDATLNHAAGVTNEQLGNFEAAATHYSQTDEATDSLERLQKLQVAALLPAGGEDVDATSCAPVEWTALVGQLPWWVRTRAAIVRPWQSIVVTGPFSEFLPARQDREATSSSEDDDSSENESVSGQTEAAGQLVGYSSSTGGSSAAPTPADVLNLLIDCFIGQQRKPQHVTIPMWMLPGDILQSGLGRLVLLLSRVGVNCRLGSRSPGCVSSLLARAGDAERAGVEVGPWSQIVRQPETAVESARSAKTPPLLGGECVSVSLVAAVFSAAAALYRTQPWQTFTGNDVFRITFDSGTRIFVALQGCTQDVDDEEDPQPEEEDSESEDDQLPNQDVWSSVSSLLGLCVASTTAQSCGCPHSQHCACGMDRRRQALRAETQRFMWYGSEQHAPYADLDAQQEHNWELVSGSQNFPLPMNVLTEGFGAETPPQYVRPSAPELQRLMILMRALAGFSAQIRQAMQAQAAAGGTAATHIGTVMRIPVSCNAETTNVEVVLGDHAWAAGTWRRFDKSGATKTDGSDTSSSDSSNEQSDSDEEVVPVPCPNHKRVQGRVPPNFATLKSRASTVHRKPFFLRTETGGDAGSSDDADADADDDDDKVDDSSSDEESSSEESSSEESSSEGEAVCTKSAGRSLRSPPVEDLDRSTVEARDSGVAEDQELHRQQEPHQFVDERLPAAARMAAGRSDSSTSDEDTDGNQTMRSLLRKHDKERRRADQQRAGGMFRRRGQARGVPSVDADTETEGLLASHSSQGYSWESSGDGLVDSAVAESFRDAVTVSPSGVMSFAAVEDDDGDMFGPDMNHLD